MSTHPEPTFLKSSYSDRDNCVEVARNMPTVLVRDTKDRAGLVLGFEPPAWGAFLDGLKAGDFR